MPFRLIKGITTIYRCVMSDNLNMFLLIGNHVSLLRTVIVLLLLSVSSSVIAEEQIYLVRSHVTSGNVIQGAAYTDTDLWEVSGYVLLKHDAKAKFAGFWTRSGKIEAVDGNGNMYVFDVIRVLSKWQAMYLAENL